MDTPFVEQTLIVHQDGVVWEDVTISKATFDSAAAERDKYQLKRIDRAPNAADSSTVREWTKSNGFDFNECIEESGFYRFEGAGDIIELGMGDYCETRTLADTTIIPTCWMCWSVDNHLAGWWSNAMYYDYGEDGAEGLVYDYPIGLAYGAMGKPCIYKTHPRWYPCGDQFWGYDGWFYVEGYDSQGNPEYHKFREYDSGEP